MAKWKKPIEASEAPTDCDRLIEAALASGQVRLRLFVENEDWVAIEGDGASLAFFGKVLSTFAQQDGPGCLILDSTETAVFDKGSLGICVYRRAEGAK